jgi:integrase/recombinase XerD
MGSPPKVLYNKSVFHYIKIRQQLSLNQSKMSACFLPKGCILKLEHLHDSLVLHITAKSAIAFRNEWVTALRALPYHKFGEFIRETIYPALSVAERQLWHNATISNLDLQTAIQADVSPPAAQSTNSDIAGTVDSVVAGWLTESCASEASRVIYRNDLKHFNNYLATAGKDILHINQLDIQAYLEFLHTQALSAATCAKKLAVIKGLIRSLSTDGLFDAREAQKILGIKAPKVSRDRRTPGLSREEARLLLDAPPSDTLRGMRDRAILAVLLYTGGRRSAICAIKVGDLLQELGNHFVVLHEKSDRRIRVPLHPQVLERIQAWMSAAAIPADDHNAYLFRPFNKRGGTLQNKSMHDFMIWHTVKKYARQAGLQVDRVDERGICAHSTRVTAIIAGFEGGAKTEEIQQLIGHKDPRNTLRYRRTSPDDTVHAAMKINY